jgi:23S rRNA (uracil1939-C5)-methyltransferase
MRETIEPAANSADEAVPPCPHFGPCGGCQLQDLAYPAQLAQKAARLRLVLSSVLQEPREIPVHASPPLGYRNRIRLTLAQVDGELRAGYLRTLGGRPQHPDHAFDSGDDDPENGGTQYDSDDLMGPGEPRGVSAPKAKTAFLPIDECPIAAPVLWRTAEALLAHAAEPEGFWLRDPRHIPDQLELFTNAGESRLNLTLSLRTNSRTLPDRIVQAFAAACDALRREIPALSGAGLSLLPPPSRKRSRRGEAPRPGPTWGQPGLNYTIPLAASTHAVEPASSSPSLDTASLSYWVPRTAFFQVNRFLLPDLLATVVSAAAAAPKQQLAWDLYAGAGLFARPLAERFAAVTAVEIAEAAAAALATTKLPNLRAVRSTTLDFLRAAILQRERPDLVLLDPPRSGAGREVCELLGRVAAPVVIYISCSPTHLAEDLEALTVAGYTIHSLQLFDLFPQTTHIESVAILTR